MKIKLLMLIILLFPILNSCDKFENQPKLYTITFDSKGGSNIETTTISEGKFITKPKDPIYAGYIFDGWYKDSELLESWNFYCDAVMQNTTLYAKWLGFNTTIKNTTITEIEYDYMKITFDIEQQQQSTDIVEAGVCLSYAENPTVDNEKIVRNQNESIMRIELEPVSNKRYVRAYITDGTNIKYGEELSFKTLPHPSNVTRYEIEIPNYGKRIVFVANDNEKNINSTVDLKLSHADALSYCLNKGSRWYLPSRDELVAFNKHLKSIGKELPHGIYWTNSIIDFNNAWSVRSWQGGADGMLRNDYALVRCFWLL